MVTKEIVRNDTNILEFEITEAYDANGNPLASLSGYSALLQARFNVNDPTTVLQKSGTISGMKVTVRLDPADTASFQGGERLVADLQLSNGTNNFTVSLGDPPGGTVFTLVVVPDVTRS